MIVLTFLGIWFLVSCASALLVGSFLHFAGAGEAVEQEAISLWEREAADWREQQIERDARSSSNVRAAAPITFAEGKPAGPGRFAAPPGWNAASQISGTKGAA